MFRVENEKKIVAIQSYWDFWSPSDESRLNLF